MSSKASTIASIRGQFAARRSVGSTQRAVLVRFIRWNMLHQQEVAQQSNSNLQQDAAHDKYEEMLKKAEYHTFSCPEGQLFGRAGRRCTLEDGERLLDWCIKKRPRDLQPRVVQLCNLMRQGLGRERDVPALAINALTETRVSGCDISSSCYVQVLQIVLLSLKALHKLELDGVTIPPNPASTTYNVTTFLQAAQAAVPGMSHDFKHLADRLRFQIHCRCDADTRRKMLSDRNGYMSCVDLQFVSGDHHAGPTVVGGRTPQALHNPREFEQALMN